MVRPDWHRCSDSCYWWGLGQGDEGWCNWECGEAMPAETGRPGCSKWVCAACLGDWFDGENHGGCIGEVEVELE